MKRLVSMLSVLFVALAFCLAGSQAVAAGKKGKAKKVASLQSFKGEVVKLAGKKGALLGINLKADDGKTYRIFKNKKGVKLVKELAGKQAELQARLIRKGTKKKPVLWLDVKEFKPVAEPAPAEEEGAGDEGGEEGP